jgi:hypothetical protein
VNPVEISDSQRRQAREQLVVIGRSDVFTTSPRLTRLLGYLVEAVLVGEGGALNQTRIALEVMGRDESFDPTTDSSVRVERAVCARSFVSTTAGRVRAIGSNSSCPRDDTTPTSSTTRPVRHRPSRGYSDRSSDTTNAAVDSPIGK